MQQKADEMLPECPIQNVRNSLMENTGQKEERVYKGFDFFSTESRRKQYMGLPSFFSLATITLQEQRDYFPWLINPGYCCFMEINVSFNRERLFSSGRFYLLMATMIFIDICISVTARSNSPGVGLGGFPPFKLHYGCSFPYRINHLTH